VGMSFQKEFPMEKTSLGLLSIIAQGNLSLPPSLPPLPPLPFVFISTTCVSVVRVNESRTSLRSSFDA